MSLPAWAARQHSLPVTHEALAQMVEGAAERVRMAFAARTIETEMGRLNCTVSAGFAFGSSEGISFDKVLSAADKALYAAKHGGRNRVLDFRRCA